MNALEPTRATGPVVIMIDEPTNREWATSEVARDLGVSPSLVRTWIAYMNWEVQRNAQGHRVFIDDDVQQLRNLKAWLDAGNSMKAFRRERQGEGPFDPRLELRNGVRRLREMQSQEAALIAKHRELIDGYIDAKQDLTEKLEKLRAEIDGEAPPAPVADTSAIVQGVLKQLMTALLEKQGKLQLVSRNQEAGRAFIEYAAPGGKKQIVEDLCATDDDRRLLETVLRIIAVG